MIQWVIWKHLAPKLVMDGERMQRLAETLTHEFHQEGVRMPLDDDPVETPLTLALELHTAGEELGPVPIPQKTLRVRERQRKVAHKLYDAAASSPGSAARSQVASDSACGAAGGAAARARPGHTSRRRP